jgi:hypothetical protein
MLVECRLQGVGHVILICVKSLIPVQKIEQKKSSTTLHHWRVKGVKNSGISGSEKAILIGGVNGPMPNVNADYSIKHM